MKDFDIYFPEIDYRFPMKLVEGTVDSTFSLGDDEKADIHINNFFISKFQITQKLWEYIMGNNPSHFSGQDRPVENISFNDIRQKNGFLDKLNVTKGNEYKLTFRLPSETEWEYAARGGPNWKDDFQFSGSNNMNNVGWYDQNSGKFNDIETLSKLKNHEKGTTTHNVGQKQPNQLGIFDMSGNVWEWCQDYFQSDFQKIPKDGSAFLEKTNERVLRGGCHHNWAIHCTVSKRFGIVPEAKDECIGLRVVASMNG